MELLSPADITLIKVGAVGLAAGIIRTYGSKILSSKRKQPVQFPALTAKKGTQESFLPTRSIQKQLEQTGKDCIIFYGSQTGTAEKLALRMVRQAYQKYNLRCIAADLNDYDFDDLKRLDKQKLVVFLLATYGDGEPTDNALSFDNFLNTTREAESTSSSLQDLHYAAFGLGNSSYRFYNSMIRRTDTILRSRGANLIGQVGLGDDGLGTLEEDFIAWSDTTLRAIADIYSLQEIDRKYEAAFRISELQSNSAPGMFVGEPNRLHVYGKVQGPFTAQNPFPARVVEARELFDSSERHCLHLEFDVSGSTITYDTGDHLAVSPMNSNVEVDRIINLLGLSERRHTAIDIASLDATLKLQVPALTTYDSLFRYYLDICSPLRRDMLTDISEFIESEHVRTALESISADKSSFEREVSSKRANLAQILSAIGKDYNFSSIPISYILENLPKLQPRYYSISSSSMVSKKIISITAVVDSMKIPGADHEFHGVSTSYLQSLKAKVNTPSTEVINERETHQTSGPKSMYTWPTALIHVRKSKFRLPRSTSTPVIMIGPGTGVAPFRAFIHERAHQHQAGKDIGRLMLFYGCRRSNEDYLYKDEWKQHQTSFLQDTFSIHTAFSREQDRKVYVQDLLLEQADELRNLILNKNAHVYVCGDATHMAKSVFKAMAGIVGEETNGRNGEAYLHEMKGAGRWREDVW